MKVCIRDKVYNVIAESKKNGITVEEIVSKTNLEKQQVYNAIKIWRHRYIAYRMGNSKVFLARSEYPGKTDQRTLMEEILERLRNGEVLNQYWRGKKTDIDDYGDSYLMLAVRELWMRGEPVLRRRNPDTRLWEYYYVKQ